MALAFVAGTPCRAVIGRDGSSSTGLPAGALPPTRSPLRAPCPASAGPRALPSPARVAAAAKTADVARSNTEWMSSSARAASASGVTPSSARGDSWRILLSSACRNSVRMVLDLSSMIAPRRDVAVSPCRSDSSGRSQPPGCQRSVFRLAITFLEGTGRAGDPYRTRASGMTVATVADEGMDTELVKRAQHGDREAFGLIAAEIANRFLAVSRRILRDLDLAEDATQQALV